MMEQIADHQEYNEKGDVYSFSLIMWEMLAGVKPFLGELEKGGDEGLCVHSGVAALLRNRGRGRERETRTSTCAG